MPFKVQRVEDTGGRYVEAPERLLLTDDGGEVVPVDDPRGRSLFCVAGQQIPREEAARFGLLDPESEDDEEDEGPSEPEPEPDPELEGGGLEGNYFSADEEDAHVCEECGYESTTAAGLGAHRRVHKDAE